MQIRKIEKKKRKTKRKKKLKMAKNGSQFGDQKSRMEQNLKLESIESNTGLLLHFNSHTDKRYKDSLLKTMLHRAYELSSTTEAFDVECAKLRSIFSRLDYPWSLIDSVISNFVSRKPSVGTTERNVDAIAT